MLVAMVIATVRTTARISVVIKSTRSKALGPDHGVEKVGAEADAEHEQEEVHGHTHSQNSMNAIIAANVTRPRKIISKSNIERLR
jgi:hypothetical protein